MSGSSPHGPRRLGSQIAVAAALTSALLAAACATDDPRTAPTTSLATTSTAPPATTTAPAPEPEPEPEPEAADAAEPADTPSAGATTTVPDPSEAAARSDLSGELRWSDVLDGLSAPAQFCILESLGEDDLEAVLVRPLAREVRATWEEGSLPDADTVAGTVGRLRAGLAESGGGLVAERIPTELRGTLDPWGRPPTFARMAAVKAAFDPDGRLNAGRYVGGL